MKKTPERKIFDRVRRHLLKQNRAAKTGANACQYLTDGGAKCAVGCLITKAAYDPDIEGWGISVVRPSHGRWVGVGENQTLARVLNKSKVPANLKVYNMLTLLQNIHDVEPVEKWPELLDWKRIQKVTE